MTGRFSSPIPNPFELLGKPTDALLPRMKKSNAPEPFNEFLQAGPDGILVDRNGRAVYYSQYLSPEFVTFIEDNFVTDGAFDPDKARGVDPDTTFPDGAVELKLSWVIVPDGQEPPDGAFTMEHEIALLKQDGNTIVIDPETKATETLALVGFHIGGVVSGHTEMIWATFEHKDNAPNVFFFPEEGGKLSIDGRRDSIAPDTAVSDDNMTFYAAGTPYRDCNLNPVQTPGFSFDAETQTFKPVTQVCREYQYGDLITKVPTDELSETRMTNIANIAMLNDSVLTRLADEAGPWKNYFELGAIWFINAGTLTPGLSLQTNELMTGSVGLSNATIETFTQVPNVQENCFRCHNTAQVFPANTGMIPMPATNLNISHAFLNLYFWSQE